MARSRRARKRQSRQEGAAQPASRPQTEEHPQPHSPTTAEEPVGQIVRRIHLLYLHGIGVRHRGRYVDRTMRQMATALLAWDEPDWAPCDMPRECGPAQFGDHAHAYVPTESGLAALTIQAFYWGADVPKQRARTVAWWMVRAAFALSLLQLAAPVGALARPNARLAELFEPSVLTRRTRSRRNLAIVAAYFLLTLAAVLLPFWLLWVVLKAITTVAAGVLGAGVVLGIPLVVWGLSGRYWRGVGLAIIGSTYLSLLLFINFGETQPSGMHSFIALGGLLAIAAMIIGLINLLSHQWARRAADRIASTLLLVNDALVWCSDRQFRDWVIAECDRRISGSGADDLVLVGHSQGGSILTEWSRTQPTQSKVHTLITLGSGQGVLATLHEVLSHRLRYGVGTWLAVLLYAATVILVLFEALVSIAPRLRELLEVWYLAFQALWTAPLADPYRALALMESYAGSPDESFEPIISGLSETPALPSTIWLVGIALGFFLVAVNGFIRPLASAILERSQLDAPGYDLSGTRDPISKPLHVLASSERLRRIPQTGSTLLDHFTYLDNRIVVLPAIAVFVRLAAEGLHLHDQERRALDEYFAGGVGEHLAGLKSLQAIRWIVSIICAPAVVAVIVGASVGNDVSNAEFAGIVALVALWTGTLWACTLRGNYLLQRNSALAAQEQTLYQIGNTRNSRRSVLWASMMILLALPLVGALFPPPGGSWEAWASSENAAVLDATQSLAALAFWVLLLAALLFLRGSRIARPVTVVAAGIAAAGWVWMGSPIAIAASVAIGLIGIVCVSSPLLGRRPVLAGGIEPRDAERSGGDELESGSRRA